MGVEFKSLAFWRRLRDALRLFFCCLLPADNFVGRAPKLKKPQDAQEAQASLPLPLALFVVASPSCS